MRPDLIAAILPYHDHIDALMQIVRGHAPVGIESVNVRDRIAAAKILYAIDAWSPPKQRRHLMLVP